MTNKNEIKEKNEEVKKDILIFIIILLLIFTYIHFDKKAEKRDLDAFEERLRSYYGFQELRDEDKSQYLQKALNEYSTTYKKDGGFIGGYISDVNKSDIYNRFTLDVNAKRNEYLK